MPAPEAVTCPARIGLVADTHLTRPEQGVPADLLEGLAGCTVIFHAGDVTRRWVLEVLGQVAPVVAVHGNNDDLDLQEALPEERILTCGPYTIGLLHGWSRRAPRRYTAREWTIERMRGVVDCAVYGHSHRAEVQERDGLLLVNPGTPTRPRPWEKQRSFGVLDVAATLHARIIDLPT